MVARHVEPLAADTSYALQLLLFGGIEACHCEGREWTTVAAFTTGHDVDDARPAFAGLEEVGYGARSSVWNTHSRTSPAWPRWRSDSCPRRSHCCAGALARVARRRRAAAR